MSTLRSNGRSYAHALKKMWPW